MISATNMIGNSERVGQWEESEAEGEWDCEGGREVQWKEGKAVGHVVILLFHPPNGPTLIHTPTVPPSSH